MDSSCGDDTNFSTIKNQQSSPIVSLIEKVTNSIDAILMKKSYENKTHPKSKTYYASGLSENMVEIDCIMLK